MVSSRALLRRSSSNVQEPTVYPGITRAKVQCLVKHTLVREVARRRRVFSEVGFRAPDTVVRNALRRIRQPRINITLPIVSPNVDMADVEAVEAGTKYHTFELPKRLIKPDLPEVQSKYLAQIDPDVRHVPVETVVSNLQQVGKGMMKVLTTTKAVAKKNVLPKSLDVEINDVSADPPTHLLAVHDESEKAGQRKITLYPVHHLMLASQCSKLPGLPVHEIHRPEEPGTRVRLPVATLGLPDPSAFPMISAFLYTHSTDHILEGLLPTPPTGVDVEDPDTVDVCRYVQHLVANYSVQALWAHLTMVEGFYRTVSSLGIVDEKIWRVIYFTWNVLISALALATEQPQPAPSWPGEAGPSQ